MLQPQPHIILVEPEDPTQGGQTKSGIYLPDAKRAGVPVVGKIYAVGKEVAETAAIYNENLKPGQRILFKEDRPQGFKHEGKGYLALEFDQILATVGDDDEVKPGKAL